MVCHRFFITIFLGTFFLSGPSVAVAQDVIDLPHAINYGLEQNRDLARSALSINSAKFGISGANAEFQVSVRPDATADFSSGDPSYGYGITGSKKLVWGTELSARSGVSRFPR